jgi:hypothetical protein
MSRRTMRPRRIRPPSPRLLKLALLAQAPLRLLRFSGPRRDTRLDPAREGEPPDQSSLPECCRARRALDQSSGPEARDRRSLHQSSGPEARRKAKPPP